MLVPIKSNFELTFYTLDYPLKQMVISRIFLKFGAQAPYKAEVKKRMSPV